MDERKRDFNKLKEVLRRIPTGEFTPKQLGELMSQYGERWLKEERAKKVENFADLLTPLVK